MPRGVYDRSKTKEQRQAEKSVGKSTGRTPKAFKGKKATAKAAGGGAVIKNVTFETAHANPNLIEASTHLQTVMQTATQAFNAVQNHVAGSNGIYNLIDQTAQRLNQIGQAITDQLFPQKATSIETPQDTAQISTRKVKNGHAPTVPAPAPVVAAPAPAPIPFNPPAPPQQ